MISHRIILAISSNVVVCLKFIILGFDDFAQVLDDESERQRMDAILREVRPEIPPGTSHQFNLRHGIETYQNWGRSKCTRLTGLRDRGSETVKVV